MDRIFSSDTGWLAEIGQVSSSTLHYWLLKHPKIEQFQWVKGQTLGSSRLFVVITVVAYLTLTFILRRSRLFLPPRLLKPFTALHSLTLALLSLLMALGCSLSLASQPPPRLRHAVCFPPATSPSGPLFFWAYIFYLSKILEFLDTLFIVLSNSARRLTFLHVYHHATVLLMSYIWLQTSQSLFPVALVTNATVHVLMYTYYLLCAVGIRPRWKRFVTNCQILQFIFSFLVSILMLYYHFNSSGCSGIWGWCFNAIFNLSLLTLFLNFHSKSYASGTGTNKIRMDKKKVI